MEDIAAAADASIGSVYHHFGGKEQLAAALYVEGLAHYQLSFLRTLRESGRGTATTVKALVRNHLDWVAANPDLAAYLASSREVDVRKAAFAQVEAMNRRAIDAARRWIDEQVAKRRIRKMPTRLFYSVVIGPAQEFSRQWLQARDDAALEQAMSVLPEAAWRAVKA